MAVLLTLLANWLHRREAEIPFRVRFRAWLGQDVSRTGTLPDGRTYREIFYANGTRFRCVIGPTETICEWTDTSGVWSRIETRPHRRNSR